MHPAGTVTIEMLYELVRDVKDDLVSFKAEVKKDQDIMRQDMKDGFAEVKKEHDNLRQEMKDGFAEVKKEHDNLKQEMKDGFAEVKKEHDSLKQEMKDGFAEVKMLIREEKREREKMEDKLEKVYEARERVVVSFTKNFAIGNAFFSALVAFVVSFFVAHK